MPQKTKRRRSISRRLKIIAVSCLGLAAVLVLFGLFSMHQERLAQARAEAASFTPAPLANSSSVPVALFIGDSYSAGTGASTVEKRWTSLVADEMGWSEVNSANGGTGYVATAGMAGCGRESCPDYQGVLPDVSDINADFVVIAGGQNDFSAYAENPAAVRAAIQDTITAYAEAFPDAELVVVGPSTPGDPTDPTVVNMAADVQAAASTADAQYVDLLDPNVIEREMLAEDGAHVTDEGHAAIAERVITALSPR